MYNEWKNKLLRESIAKSSLVKMRKINSSTFFTKGKLNDFGFFLRDKENVNLVFINSVLTTMQKTKLEKRWNDLIHDREERIRRHYLKSVQKKNDLSPSELDTDTVYTDVELENTPTRNQRKVKVVDRFDVILQIFASRARSQVA
jgi:50S ribosomal subunit-associated GTPase HflX